ncbi:MAG: hypothetical protein RLZZ524_382 [Pseudomonadota bacterium]
MSDATQGARVPTRTREQALARLADSRLRLACALAAERAAERAGERSGDGARERASEPSSERRDDDASAPEADEHETLEGWLVPWLVPLMTPFLTQALRGDLAPAAWAELRRWLQRRPWQAAAAAALFGAVAVPLMRRRARRDVRPDPPSAWGRTFARSLARSFEPLIDRIVDRLFDDLLHGNGRGASARSDCRDLMAGEAPWRRTTGANPGVFR